MIWYKLFPHDEFVRLELPEGWSGQLMLGTRSIPEVSPGHFELGNALRALAAPEAEYDLWLSLKNAAGGRSNRKITTIACKPTFVAPPIEVIDSILLGSRRAIMLEIPGAPFKLKSNNPAEA